MAGLLLAHRLRDRDPKVFDRRRSPGKQCTGIVSRNTFEKLSVSKEFLDREFKEIRVVYNSVEIYIRGDFVRLGRERLERWLDSDLGVIRPVDAVIKGMDEVVVGSSVYRGKVYDASGWKGKANWVKAIEYVMEPINQEEIVVTLDPRNPAGFGWIVPLPDRTLVGALSRSDPRPFVPKLQRRVLSVHGGAIPRVKPTPTPIPAIGDRTGLIKTFTGGGIFGIAELLEDFSNFNRLRKEISRQYTITSLLEKTWRLGLTSLRFMNGKTLSVNQEFDFHSFLFSLRKL
ncbi:NAD(P)/FAD-dependent oxidoreductase [Metallosphaera sedula]|uniref:NAD(P)/FAD-dependent oxidoreductase n=1 Tax=Metallosphaera prunae TaxID=47304 RepID=A0A4D8S6S2_METPR|nr:NAD(P)/FAD-dependent oxidoreductase [Metallosphaera prunae]